MKIAIILGRGIEGCGITRLAIEYKNWLEKNNFKADIFALIEKKFSRHKSHDFQYQSFSPKDDVSSKLNNYNKVVYLSVPSIKNSKEWFGKSITSSDVMDEKFNVMLRYPKIKGTLEPDYDRAPTMTVKLPCWSGVWKSEIYDEEGEPLYVNGKTNSHLNPLEFLTSKSQVITLIQCGGLWFVNGKVSITWNLKQAMVKRPSSSLSGRCLLFHSHSS